MGGGSSKFYRREDLNYPPNVYPPAVEAALSDAEIDEHLKLLDHAGLLFSFCFASLLFSNLLYFVFLDLILIGLRSCMSVCAIAVRCTDAALAARFESLTLDEYQKHFRAAPDKFDW